MNLLDAGILGQLCHAKAEQNRPIGEWLQSILDAEEDATQVFVPEIADYELRRKLLHLIAKRQASRTSIDRLDNLGKLLEYLPLDTDTMRRAAELWAQARRKGVPTASDEALDCDVLIAAQAQAVGATVVTTNKAHLARFVPAVEWSEVKIPRRKGRR
jgi:predicted nucleic acid-binding protein